MKVFQRSDTSVNPNAPPAILASWYPPLAEQYSVDFTTYPHWPHSLSVSTVDKPISAITPEPARNHNAPINDVLNLNMSEVVAQACTK